MSYKLEQIFTKTNDQDWSGVIINTEVSLNSTPDPRDNQGRQSFSNDVLKQRYFWFTEFKRRVGSNYIGWNREYIHNNQLIITYELVNEATARILYEECVEHRKVAPYTISYRLTNSNGDEISL